MDIERPYEQAPTGGRADPDAVRLVVLHSSAESYGSDKSLRSLCESATDRGDDVVVILPMDGPLVGELRRLGATVMITRVGVLRRASMSLRGMVTLLRDLGTTLSTARGLRDPRWKGRTVVISNTSVVLSGWPAALMLRAPHVAIVREFYRPGGERRVFQALLGRARLIVCVSGHVRRQFGTGSRAHQRSHVVHSGADLAHHSVPARPAPSDVLAVACVGRINSWKGQDVLIRATKILIDRGHKLKVTIVGAEFSGHEVTDSLRALIAELNLEGQVQLVGELAADQVRAVYETSDLVAVPSTTPEPFGKVVIEAMNYGCCVVASRAGGPLDVIEAGVNGELVEPGDPDAFAAAMERYITEPELLDEVGTAAFNRSLAFDARVCAGRIVDLAHRVVEARR